MSIEDKKEERGLEKIIQKILPNKHIEISIHSVKLQLAHIRIANLVGVIRLSSWQEIRKGQNTVSMDVNSLVKGTYKILIDFPDENTREELFIMC